jgi:small subunit ribosomal protein S17
MSNETIAGGAAAAGQPAHAERGRRQQKIGRVTSDKMQKTIVVAVETLKRDPLYKRTYKYTTKFKAHDEHNTAHIGDTVRIEETRPLSKDKRWRLVEIIRQVVQVKPVEQVVAELDPNIGNNAENNAENEER